MFVWVLMVAAALLHTGTLTAEPPTAEEVAAATGGAIVHEATCFTDFHFFDGWATTTTAEWGTDMPKPWLNAYDLEVWSQGVRLRSVPLGAGSLDITDIPRPSLKVVHRRTQLRAAVPKVAATSAHCSFMPPPDGSAWVWQGDGFVLVPVVTTGPPIKSLGQLRWETVVLDE